MKSPQSIAYRQSVRDEVSAITSIPIRTPTHVYAVGTKTLGGADVYPQPSPIEIAAMIATAAVLSTLNAKESVFTLTYLPPATLPVVCRSRCQLGQCANRSSGPSAAATTMMDTECRDFMLTSLLTAAQVSRPSTYCAAAN